MPTKKRIVRPPPPPEDPSVTKYKLFASSRSSSGIKVKGRTEPKMEDRRPSTASQSSQHAKVTNSQFSVVISDSGSEDEGDSDAGPSTSSVSQGKKAVIHDDQDDEADKDADEEMANSEASSSRQPRSGNRAKCSRGRGGSNMQAGSNGHVFKVSSFKPLSKQAATQSKPAGIETQERSRSSNGTFSAKKAESQKVEPPVKAKEQAENGKANEKGKGRADMFRGISDSEEDEEEFHEPTQFRRSVSAKSNSSLQKSASVEIPPNEKKRKASNDEKEEDNEDDDIIDSVLGQAVQSRESSTKSEAEEDYITREEHQKALRDLREEMKQEMDTLKGAMRIETKRLIRTEVKDEIALQRAD